MSGFQELVALAPHHGVMQKGINMGIFAAIAKIVNLVRIALKQLHNIKAKADRENAILGVLRIYFIMKDIVDDGLRLLESVGPDPIKKISAMDAERAIKTLEKWDVILRRQGHRLYTLQGFIYGQHHLTIINPELQEQISEIIGYKMDRAVTLHGIGAALLFRNMMPIKETDEEREYLVHQMLGAEEDGTLDVDRAKNEIEKLSSALKEYRQVLEQIVHKDELIALSNRARQQTLIQDDA